MTALADKRSRHRPAASAHYLRQSPFTAAWLPSMPIMTHADNNNCLHRPERRANPALSAAQGWVAQSALTVLVGLTLTALSSVAQAQRNAESTTTSASA